MTMCLGIPGRIVEVWEENGARMARADFAGELRKVCLAYLPDLAVGDHILAHAGFALTRLDEQEAKATLDLMREFAIIDAPAAEPTTTGVTK
jgi:hydrogenase expression/formation protein HypC